MRADARRFENWETNFAGKIGPRRRDRLRARLGHAGYPGARRRVYASVASGLEALPGVTVHDRQRRCGIVTFAVAGTRRRRSSGAWPTGE